MEINSYEEGYGTYENDISGGSVLKPSLLQVSALYSAAIILFIFIGTRVQRREFYSGLLITEFILIMLPPLIMLAVYKFDMKKVLRLNRVGLLNLTIIFFIMLFALPLVGVLNLGNLMLIRHIFGRVAIQQIPAADNIKSLIMNIVVIGGAAGICEEVLFRGVIQRGFEKLGVIKAILITAFLFGLMHIDFQRLLGTFLLGALIGFIVYRTNSLFAGMFAHFMNNSIAVFLTYGVNKLSEFMKQSGLEGASEQQAADFDFSALANMPREQLIVTIVVWSVLLLFCVIVFTGLIIGLIKNTTGKAESIPVKAGRTGKKGLLWLIPGLAIVVFIYFVQGLKLRGIKIELIENIMGFIGFR